MPLLNIRAGWDWASQHMGHPEQSLLLPLFYIAKSIVAYASAVSLVYLFIPGLDIYFGFKNLFCHANLKSNASDRARYAVWPAYKLFEQIGEAVPQFTIAVTFYSLNWHWLSPWDRGMGVGTMTLSAGSILMGVAKGGMIVKIMGLKEFLTDPRF